MSEAERRPLSRRGLYVLPTLFTVGNLFCGYLSVWNSINASFEWAAGLIFIAALLDGLDGRVARMTNTASEFGEQYDSLADVISFGMAPAILLYFWGLSGEPDLKRLGFMVSFLFVVSGSMRLARFNIQTHVVDKKYFVGLPIPMAASVPAGLVLAQPGAHLTRTGFFFLLAMTAALSYLMVSTIRYRSFKDLDLKRRRPVGILLVIALVMALVGFRPAISLVTVSSAFALSGPLARAFAYARSRFKRAA
ncbi:MAG: CDP-diacylglycerol--serine O-phosphatidyltransferase [Thermoanaerobaculia bacterium]